jgi:valyl-tRNA synthetase
LQSAGIASENNTANDEAPKELSKNQLKKLAKGKGKVKEKPDWNSQPKKDKKVKIAPATDSKATYVNPTPKGEKKDLSKIPMADGYNPIAVESAWQDWWEASGFYSCDPQFAMNKSPKEDKFVMVIPPPNVTGSLHLGHALTAAVEDTLTRWHRMKGHATLYVPGT